MSDIDFTLSEKQLTALQSKATEILYGGAAYGGKSYLLRAASIIWCHMIPGLQVYLFRRTYPDLMRNHVDTHGGYPDMIAPFVEAGLCKFRFTDKIIHWGNGAQIHLCHCQLETDRRNYLGAEIHVLLIDELGMFTSIIYDYLRARVRKGALVLPEGVDVVIPKVMCGSNPGGIGHGFMKSRWIDPMPPFEIYQAPRDQGGMLRQFIPALMEDNTAVDDEERDEYELRLEGIGDPALARAMRFGDWSIVAGSMFDDVWDPNIHIIKPFSVGWWAESDGTEAMVPLDYESLDQLPHRKDEAHKVAFIQVPAGTLFRIDEWYGWNGNPNQGCRMLAIDVALEMVERETVMGYPFDAGPADTGIWTDERGGCIADDMAELGIDWIKADKSPGSRKNGWERIRMYLQSATRRPMEHAGVYVFNKCRQIIRTLPILPRSDRNPEDINTDAEDHAADEFRYRITHESGAGSTARPSGWRRTRR